MLEFNYNNVESSLIGKKDGLETQKEFKKYEKKIAEIVTNLQNRKNNEGQWLKWMDLGNCDETLYLIKEYAAAQAGKFENVLVLGIGGSALGGLAVTEALLKPYWNLLSPEKRNNLPRLFFVDNIDADTISGLLDTLDLKRTLVNVITKSGNTVETMAQMMLAIDFLKEKLGDKVMDNIIITTDKKNGNLKRIVDDLGVDSFIVPDGVGGRFSVLSSVGMLPAAVIGIDIREMLSGAADMEAACADADVLSNPAYIFAAVHYAAMKANANISVMMPYSDRLLHTAEWFAQLWAESLGKRLSKDGKVINTGLTPVRALGVTDQHSQIQLYTEGPFDKTICFLNVEKCDNELLIPSVPVDMHDCKYLAGQSFNKLIASEFKATEQAVNSAGKMNMKITLSAVNEDNMGALLYLFEMATAVMGELLDIDAFDQPGVEAGKIATFALMGKEGYAEKASEILKNKERKEKYLFQY